MKKLFVAMCSGLLMLGVGTTRSFAQNTSLQDLGFYVNGSAFDQANTYPGDPVGFSNAASGAFINLGSYNLTTGLGTITFDTTNTGAFVAGFILPVSVPFYNEYGSTAFTASSGETWGIYNADYPTTTFGSDFAAGTPSGQNELLSGSDDYSGLCDGEAGCDATPGILIGDTLGALALNDEWQVTIDVSQTSCVDGGICLEESQFVDTGDGGSNATTQPVYFTLDATQVPIGTVIPPVPEPSPWILLATGLLGVGMIQVRRKYSAQGVL